MIPARIVVTEALPLTPAGKDRGALPAVDLVLIASSAEGDPPRTDVEKALAPSGASALGLEAIGSTTTSSISAATASKPPRW